MRKIKYSIVCEDDAQKLFVQHILSRLQQHGTLEFEFDHAFYKKYKANSRKEVENNYIQVIDYSVLYPYLLDIVLIGIDYDDRPKDKFDLHYNELYNKISGTAKNNAVIFFPVQAIEHWLIFIKKRKENPAATKNFSTEIEKISRKEAKTIIYPNRKEKEADTISLLNELDIEWLKNQSKSFLRFHEKLLQVIGQ